MVSDVPRLLVETMAYPRAVATPLNCPGMYRGLVREGGVMKTAIFDDEVLE
jgi:hypothetical protein